MTLKRNKYHIIHAWILLLCFIAGQFVVYGHTHPGNVSNTRLSYHNRDTQPKTTVSENCRLCDAMQHNAMAVNSTAYFAPVVVTRHVYKEVNYQFIGYSFIYAAGRAPPMA